MCAASSGLYVQEAFLQVYQAIDGYVLYKEILLRKPSASFHFEVIFFPPGEQLALSWSLTLI